VREYETTFIVQPEISEEGREALLEKFDNVLARFGSGRLFVEDMGKRRLAYDIQEFQKGHYLSLHYLNEGSVVKHIERTMQLEGSILRYLTILVDERVSDVEARSAEGVELERIRHERAIERAAARLEEEEAEEREASEAEAERERTRGARDFSRDDDSDADLTADDDDFENAAEEESE